MLERWDLIVVGAGSAGAALAARSAVNGLSVLLLEAGPEYRAADMDSAWRSLNPLPALRSTHLARDLLWPGLLAARTASQRPTIYWRGRGVGGSSAVNGQIAIRPPREDFDTWRDAGCVRWSFDEILPYLNVLESDTDFGAADYHGSTGPTPVFRMPYDDWGAVDQAFAEAMVAYGFEWCEDVNAPGATGVSPLPINCRDLQRVTTNDGYLEPARALGNLEIRGNATVDTVLIAEHRAIGVSVIHDGRRVEEYADRVALCAGAIHTPGVLIRSGVGPAADVRRLDLDVVCDLPVGLGLQDHPTVKLTLPLRASAVAAPDARHTNCCTRFTSDSGMGVFNDMMAVSMNHAVLSMAHGTAPPDHGSLGIVLNAPLSRGRVTVDSRDPFTQPGIAENMLSDPTDLKRLCLGVDLLMEISDHASVRRITREPVRAANSRMWDAARAGGSHLGALLTQSAGDAQHAAGTCRMGPAGSSSAVVAPDLTVQGVEGLYVADASVFPSVPRANTHLATIMVGELLADRLR